jgi:ketopantoate reductase
VNGGPGIRHRDRCGRRERACSCLRRTAAGAKPSALLDHEARRVSEIDVINGAVPRQGARVGVAAPVNATLTAVIKAIERQWA